MSELKNIAKSIQNKTPFEVGDLAELELGYGGSRSYLSALETNNLSELAKKINKIKTKKINY